MDEITHTTLLHLAIFVGLGSALACNAGDGQLVDSDTDTVYDEGDGLEEGECTSLCGTPGCGVCPSTTMVDGGGFMIDATEVTNEQYAALLEVDFDAVMLPRGCEWKSGFEPDDWADDLAPELPVVGVDWCDAALFCAWSGKRLCGAVESGPADWDNAEDSENDAWYRACSNAGVNSYPYGTAYLGTACNGAESGLGALSPGGSIASCEGGVPGLFDMSGNVWEWSDSCESIGGDANTKCRRRGGSRHSDEKNLRCGVDSGRDRGKRDNGIGFRCCSK